MSVLVKPLNSIMDKIDRDDDSSNFEHRKMLLQRECNTILLERKIC